MTDPLTRRQLLGSTLGLAGVALAGNVLPRNLSKALAAGPPRSGSFQDIRHVVVLTQENRSFDHYFGTMPGVRGFGDPNALRLPDGRPVFYQPDPDNADGYLLPFHLDTHQTNAQALPSTSHAWSVQHQAWDGGKMDDWVPAHLTADGRRRRAGQRPWDIALSSDGTRAYVTQADQNAVAVINTTTNRIVARIPVGDVPTGLAVGVGQLWVTNKVGQTISIINTSTDTVTSTVPAGSTTGVDYEPNDVAFQPLR